MTNMKRFAVVGALLSTMLFAAGVAAASTTAKHHPKKDRIHPFAPDTLRGAPEVSGVILDRTTNQFKQVVFDRGRVIAVTADSITLRQQQAGVFWRTQVFTVPATAKVTTAANTITPLASIPVGSVARIETSGAIGGAPAVVRINAFHRNAAVPMPSTTAPCTTCAVTKHPRLHPFAPDSLRGAPEVGGVILDKTANQFKQVVFDRGRVTAVTADSITLRQQQAGVFWRTETFTVPATAKVTMLGTTVVPLASIPVNSVARVESSGAIGGTLDVVRINARHHGTIPMPPTNPPTSSSTPSTSNAPTHT
jgi:hypothetical protein